MSDQEIKAKFEEFASSQIGQVVCYGVAVVISVVSTLALRGQLSKDFPFVMIAVAAGVVLFFFFALSEMDKWTARQKQFLYLLAAAWLASIVTWII